MSEQASTPRPVAAFVCSLIAGLWMLLARGMMSGMGWGGMHDGGTRSPMGDWMWNRCLGGRFVSPMGWPWPGAVFGVVVLAGAILVYSKPQQRVLGGLLILVGSTITLVWGAGGIVPGALGIVGGMLALLSIEPAKPVDNR